MRKKRNIPGFKTTMAATTAWLAVLVLIPLSSVVFTSWPLSASEFWRIVWNPRAISAYKLTFGGALVAAAINGVLGLLIAWVLARYKFFGKNLVNSLIDIPFALPTAVAGLTYSSLYSESGWLGRFLVPMGIKAVQTPLAVVLVPHLRLLAAVRHPVRSSPSSRNWGRNRRRRPRAATRWQSFRYVIFPSCSPPPHRDRARLRPRGSANTARWCSSPAPATRSSPPLLIMYQLEDYNFARRGRHRARPAHHLVPDQRQHQPVSPGGPDAMSREDALVGPPPLLILLTLSVVTVLLVLPA
jgi:sulfate transport system permease protein